MSRQPKVVASDLDGTLLCSNGNVSDVTRSIWSSLPGRGIETVVVTARPPRWLDHLGELIGDHGIAICGNGAFIYHVAQRRIVESFGFSPLQAADLVASVLRRHPTAGAALETDRGMFRTAAYPDLHVGIDEHSAGIVDCELDEVPDDVVVGKILIRSEGWEDDSFVADLTELIADRGVLAYSGAGGLAEISAPGVTKAARLARWCTELNVHADEVWAFGDMPNDIPMLTWAGRGVAVANAHESVHAVADDRCAANDEDGVARYLATNLKG